MLQTIWETYVNLFIGDLIVPALNHPIEATCIVWTLLAAVIVSGR